MFSEVRFLEAVSGAPRTSEARKADTRISFGSDVLRRRARDAAGSRLKRTVDFVVAALGLLMLAPVFALVALAIKLDSKGPVLFRQKRYGKQKIPSRF